MPRASKLQRWTDLLAALLRYRYPVARDTLWQEVPAYAGFRTDAKAANAVQRMFERDKDELRALGVPIETVVQDATIVGYRLRARDFYLPFLQLARDGHGTRPAASPRPRAPRGDGYQALTVLAFPPEELDAVVQAGRRVMQLGDPVLTADADTALRKLAHDLATEHDVGEDAVTTAPTPGVHVAARAEADRATFELLADALRRRKRITGSYHAMGRDQTRTRTIEPLGLAFLNGHWYLVGRDPAADGDGIRQFRLGRLRDVQINRAHAQKPDFELPPGFDLARHVESRQAWELGDGEAITATVRFTPEGRLAAEQLQLGHPVPGKPAVRRFVVRRPEPFARWLLSFAGAARPEGPDDIVRAWRDLARATLAQYGATP